MSRRWLLFADTPLHVLNGVELVMDALFVGDIFDLVISDQFTGARDLGEQLRDRGVFRNIYSMRAYDVSRKMEMRRRQVLMMLGRSAPFLPETDSEGYDFFAVACPCPLAYAMLRRERKKNPEIRTCLYEEGTGTYTGNIFMRASYLGDVPTELSRASGNVWQLMKSLERVLPRQLKYNPELLVVKHPELLQYQPGFDVERLTNPGERLNGVVSGTMLSAPDMECVPASTAIVFDGARVPLERGAWEDAIDNCISLLEQKGVSYRVRQHPRTILPARRNSNLKVGGELSGGMWETACVCYDMSRMTMMGISSTAQLAPFLEGSQKPTLIFLYEIALDKDSPEYEASKRVASLALAAYGDEEMIHTPESLEELSDIIDFLMTGEGESGRASCPGMSFRSEGVLRKVGETG